MIFGRTYYFDDNIFYIIARFMGFDSLVLRLVFKNNTKFLDSCVAVFETSGNDYDPFKLMVTAQILSVVTLRVTQCMKKDPKLMKYCPAPLLKRVINHKEYRSLVQDNEDYKMQMINTERRKLYQHRSEVLYWEKIRKRVADKIFIEPKITHDFDIEKYVEEEKKEFVGKFIVKIDNGKIKCVNTDEPKNFVVTHELYLEFLRKSRTQHNFRIPDYVLSAIKNDDILELRQYFEDHSMFVEFIKRRAKNDKNVSDKIRKSTSKEIDGTVRENTENSVDNLNEWIETQNINDLSCDFLDVIPRSAQMYKDLAKRITINDSCEMLHHICSEYRYTNKILLDIFTENIDYKNIANHFMMVPQIYLFENTDLVNLIYKNTKKMKVTNDLLLLFEIFGIDHGKTMVVHQNCIWTGIQNDIKRHLIKINKYITREELSELMKNYKRGDPVLDNIRDKYSLIKNKYVEQLFYKIKGCEWR